MPHVMQFATCGIPLRHGLAGGRAQQSALIDRTGHLDAHAPGPAVVAVVNIFAGCQASVQTDPRLCRRLRRQHG